ncbi:MAG: T9SS type A sorting domain-containing protein [Ferruginibacter sp.]
MNVKLLLTSVSLGFTMACTAQTGNMAYAITGDGNNDFLWMNIRQIDLTTGQPVKTIFERSKTAFSMTDVTTKKAVTDVSVGNENIFGNRDYPTANFVAAAALDARNNRLYYIPMRMNELRWLNLDAKAGSASFYTMPSPLLHFGDVNDEANNVTRMVIAADGNGYAVTNDGNHLLKFTTGRMPSITDMGSLVDAGENKGVSVHNKCTSWGGDMIADAFGKLYIISASRNVFVIDVDTRMTTHVGTISGLPAPYTTNGAAVNTDGEVVVCSANIFDGYYKFNIDDLAAKKIEGSDVKYNASDLANGNMLHQKESDARRSLMLTSTLPGLKEISGSDNRVFPNPVTGSSFTVVFENRVQGNYTIVLTDIAGRTLQSKVVNINKGNQSETVKLSGKPSKGMYMVKVLDEAKQVVFTDKVMIQ